MRTPLTFKLNYFPYYKDVWFLAWSPLRKSIPHFWQLNTTYRVISIHASNTLERSNHDDWSLLSLRNWHVVIIFFLQHVTLVLYFTASSKKKRPWRSLGYRARAQNRRDKVKITNGYRVWQCSLVICHQRCPTVWKLVKLDQHWSIPHMACTSRYKYCHGTTTTQTYTLNRTIIITPKHTWAFSTWQRPSCLVKEVAKTKSCWSFSKEDCYQYDTGETLHRLHDDIICIREWGWTMTFYSYRLFTRCNWMIRHRCNHVLITSGNRCWLADESKKWKGSRIKKKCKT